MNKFHLLFISLLISPGAFAQNAFLNESYRLQKQPVKIALMPLFDNDKLYTQSIYDNLLKDGLAGVSLAKQEIISNAILTDSLLNNSIRSIVTKEYTENELTSNPNLSGFLNEQERMNLKQLLDNADLLLIPSAIKLRSVKGLQNTGNTTVYGRFRLYDLNTGALVFDLNAENKVDYLVEQEDVAKTMEVLLESFHGYYVKNFIVRNSIR